MSGSNLQLEMSEAATVPRNGGGEASQGRPFPKITGLHLLGLAAAFGALFWINLERLWQWTNPSSGDPNWGHAIFIPLIGIAYLLERRDRLAQTPVWPSLAGLFIIVCGLVLFVGGIGVGANFVQFGPYLQDVAMLTTLFGCVVAIFGWSMVRVAAFPIAYLLCALPWPAYIHEALTVPLQKVAATASVWVLQLTGMNVEQAGNTIHILNANGVDRALNVAEACSGMRSLITFIAIGLAVAFLSGRSLWKKIIISAMAVPIAIACNIFRIAGEGLLDQHVSRRLSEGFAHSAVGVVLLVPGFGLFLLVGWLLDRLAPQSQKQQQAASHSGAPTGNGARTSAAGLIAPRKMYGVVVCILLVAATGLAAAQHTLRLHFVKISVPLERPLADLPADFGPWRQCGGNRTITNELEQKLGTSDYVFRDYVDERVVGEEAVEAMRRGDSDAELLVQSVNQSRPGSVVRVAVTYYTGHLDAVIHQSERCNLAGGIATSIASEPQTWDLGGRPLNVRVVHLMNDNPQARIPHYVAYVYCVNGHEETEAWRVRGLLMNVFEQYAWYAKIEVTTSLADPNESRRVLTDFLRSALPQIEGWFPGMRSSAASVNSAPGRASAGAGR